MANFRSWIGAALLACPLTACDDDGPQVQTAVYENQNTLCLLQKDGRVRIYALSGACNCSGVTSATCAAVAADDRIAVSSRTVITTATGPGLVCPTACETKSALCSGDLPEEGQYEVTHGSEQAVVGLPLRGTLQLFGRSPPSYCDDLVETLEANGAFEQDAAP